MENNRIDKGPEDLSVYDIQTAANFIAESHWKWRNANPKEMSEGEAIRVNRASITEAEEAKILLELRDEIELMKGGGLNE